jgi:hypothetical protein
MKPPLAGLRFFTWGYLHINILPGVGSRCLSFFLCFVGLDFNDAPHYLKRNKNPGLCLRLDHEVKFLFSFDKNPAIRKSR